MFCIGDSHFGNAIEFFRYRACTAFVAEVTAPPIDRILEHAVTRKPLSFVVKNNTSTLRRLKVGNVNEFTIVSFITFNFNKICMERRKKMEFVSEMDLFKMFSIYANILIVITQ